MLSTDYIRNNKEEVVKGARNKGVDIDIDRILELDNKYRGELQEIEGLRAERNKVSDSISGESDANRKEENIKKAEELKKNLKEKEEELKNTKEELDNLLMAIPNIPHEEVPVGGDDSYNEVLRTVGEKPDFNFEPKDYLTIAKQNEIIDMERASKVSGSRFGYIKNEAALLEFALVRFAIDIIKEEGFSMIIPPVMVRSDSMRRLGYLEKEPDDFYYLEKDDMHLVGTSEQSVVPMYMDETLQEKDLPKRFGAFSTCFRREAGSYGKDTKGILRVHQFDKVEMVSFVHPSKSREEHKLLLSLQEKLMQALEIPYQVVAISTGDMGFPAAEQFDIESWMPGEGKYRETHSTSNTTDFQARRLNTNYKGKDEKGLVHILNGTAFAIGRTIIALLENHQEEDGSVNIPKALHPYLGFEKIG